MKFSIRIPFSEINFINAEARHKKYFESLLFSGKYKYPKPIYKINIYFEDIQLSGGQVDYLEEDTIASNGSLFIRDTKDNKVELKFNEFSKTKIDITVDPKFDLYFLYNFIIEPLLIIWAAEHGILYVHSSAIVKPDGAHIFPAWRHTGKTSSVFSLANEGVEFMSDDFCIIYNNKAYLYPKNINIFSYNFESFPWLYNRIDPALATRIRLSVFLKKSLYWLSQRLSGSLSKIFFRLSELAEISTNTKVTPTQLGLKVRANAPLSNVVFITKADKATRKRKLAKEIFKKKLLAVTIYEISDFLDIYQKYKYLFTGIESKIIDSFAISYLNSAEKNLESAYEARITALPNKDAYLK
jgi:hypothetical protein